MYQLLVLAGTEKKHKDINGVSILEVPWATAAGDESQLDRIHPFDPFDPSDPPLPSMFPGWSCWLQHFIRPVFPCKLCLDATGCLYIQVFDWCFTSGRGSNPDFGVYLLEDHVPFKGGYGVAVLFL